MILKINLKHKIEIWKTKLKVKFFIKLINLVASSEYKKSFIQTGNYIDLHAVLHQIKDSKIKEVFRPFITTGYCSNIISKRIDRGEFIEIIKTTDISNYWK